MVFYVTTGQHAKIRADGTDVNHNLNLIPKGTGTVQANGVPVVTTTGAQDLTNKTLTSPTITSPTGNIVTSIDGASGAITGVARRVATTSYTGAVTNQWAKVLTWTASTAYYSQSILMGFVATPGVALTATVLVQFTNNAAGVNPTGNVYMTSLGSDPGRIDANAFKLVGGAYGEPIELWVKQKSYTALAVFEIARYNNGGTLTYLTNDPLQGTEPVGSVINVSTNGVVAGDVPVVTTTGTQTLTNKTLTSPRVNQILDTNGAIALDFSGTPSAANYLWAANAVAADFPKLRALGSATDVSLGFRPKGAGTFRFQAPAGEEALQIVPIASAVNYFRFDSSATGSPLPIWAGGTDTNISINLRPKGTGTVQQNGVPVVTISGTQTLTNKTINASNNTISNLDTADFAANAIVTKSEGISSNDNDTTLPTSAAVKSYVDKGGIVYATTNTAGTYNGQYTPILQVDITAQYTTGRFLARVLTSGAPPPEYVDIDLYIDQYDVLGGSDPTITLKVKNATASTVDEDQFIAVLTTHTGSQSTVTLYVKIDDMWKVWLVQPKFNEFSAGAGTYTWLSNQSYVASLPGGSQSVGVAGEVVINDDKFILQDSSDKTKKLKFELSSISASTTRTLTVPDASGTIALTSDIAAAGGMLAPAQGMTLGSETFTISSGTVTQISGTTINGYTPAIGDRILVANAPAT
ncbi:MAG: hypothetical protein QG549_925, partial [Patescibacteria group bacterium]|nr:hypothetical protein [Patescibacteria group bacterium]